jgi:hypothetical protein
LTERRTDPTKRDRLSQIAEGYEAQNRRTTFYLRLFVVLFGVAGLVFTFQQIKLGDQGDTTAKLAQANQRLGIQIQIERARSVRDSCEAQNGRHDNTIVVLDQQLVQLDVKQVRHKLSADKRREAAKLVARAKRVKTPKQVRRRDSRPRAAGRQEGGRADRAVARAQRVPHRRVAPVRDCDKAVHDAVHHTG